MKLNQVENWLSKQLTYTLHKPVYQTIQTRPVIVYAIDELWQLDLVDLSKLARENDGHKFILSIIDVLSKYGWLLLLKSKHGAEIKGAPTRLFKQTKRRPAMVQTDKGTEFLNSQVQNFLKKYQINFFTTFSERKTSTVERFNRTIKGIMFRLFTRNNNRRYIDFLNEIAHRYNNSCHRSIKMKPIEVSKENEPPQVWINFYENKLKYPQTASQRSRFSAGYLVRISIERAPFKKGYLEGWSKELFVVKHAVGNNPTVYKLQDQSGEDIKKTFYSKEIQKFAEPESYRIEKVIRKKRDRAGNLLYFVKWKGYPDKFNSFVRSEDLTR